MSRDSKMDLIAGLITKARNNPRKIVFPEGQDEKILAAAARAAKAGVALPVLLGPKDKVKAKIEIIRDDVKLFTIVDPSSPVLLDKYSKAYSELRGLPAGAALRILKHPVYFGAMMVRLGEADAMVAGISCPTEDVATASELIIGLKQGVSTPSSYSVLDVPGYAGPQGSLLVFADAALNPAPDAEQLADIAIATAESVAELLGWQPRVAMLSFSTKGSAYHCAVNKVAKAVELVRGRAPNLLVDGELQADAALVPEVAQRKLKGSSPVAGQANVLIFPNLDAGNIAHKLVQRLTGARAYGPILLGFNKPVSDLSRGASVEDILGSIVLTVLQGTG